MALSHYYGAKEFNAASCTFSSPPHRVASLRSATHSSSSYMYIRLLQHIRTKKSEVRSVESLIFALSNDHHLSSRILSSSPPPTALSTSTIFLSSDNIQHHSHSSSSSSSLFDSQLHLLHYSSRGRVGIR